MNQPGAPPPYPSYPPGGFPPPGPRPKPDLGRAGCLPAALAASPFLLVALVCVVIGVWVIVESGPTPRPPRQTTTTTVRGSIPDSTDTTDPDDPSPTTDRSTPSTRPGTTR